MPTLYHPKLDAEFEAVNDDQADALAASGWRRKKTGQTAPAKTTARRKRAAKKAAPATPKADAAKTEEK